MLQKKIREDDYDSPVTEQEHSQPSVLWDADTKETFADSAWHLISAGDVLGHCATRVAPTDTGMPVLIPWRHLCAGSDAGSCPRRQAWLGREYGQGIRGQAQRGSDEPLSSRQLPRQELALTALVELLEPCRPGNSSRYEMALLSLLPILLNALLISAAT